MGWLPCIQFRFLRFYPSKLWKHRSPLLGLSQIGGKGFKLIPLLTRCLKFKIHFISSKKRFKTLLINFKQVFTSAKGFLLELVSKFISLKIFLLIVRASSGRYSSWILAKDNDDFIASESDRQMLLIKQQDEELDELSASVQRIGGVGLTIHEELLAQEKILDELGTEMDSTKNRLDFIQKKIAMVMKKAGAKGQIMIIIFLLVLFIILFILVFFT